ncbi:MAG TPA: hypothetical protein VMU51_39425 [Mycobacteriales bacterium]|nr:hypothetical protein [Mycobacteriales bacterium]
MRTGLLVTAGWLAAAAAASAVSWSAVTLATSAVPEAHAPPHAAIHPDTDPLGVAGTGTPSPQSTARRSASPTGTPSGHPPRSGTPGSSGPGGAATGTSAGGAPVRAFGTGGSVTFHCAGTGPVYLNMTPQLGYHSDPDDSGSGEVRFQSATHRTDLTIRCTNGTPHWSAAERELTGGGGGDGGDDHGGGNSGSGSSGSGKSGGSG